MIADDQRLFADGLRVVIESRFPSFRVVGIATNGRQAVSMVDDLKPDIILMDVRMPELDGVQATRLIRDKHPDAKILILTTFSDDEYVTQSLEYGAVGYLLKNRSADDVVEAIHALSAAGILQIDPAVSKHLFTKKRERTANDEEFLARMRALSEREQQVLDHMASGKRIAEIAQDLSIAEQTVRNHISNVYFKLHVHDRLEILRYVGLIKEFLGK
jgi:DNA-binding NarL/FixJ family response regulator